MSKEEAVKTILQELDTEKTWFLSSVDVSVTQDYVDKTIADLKKEAHGLYKELKSDTINEAKRFTSTTKYDKILVAIEVLEGLDEK